MTTKQDCMLCALLAAHGDVCTQCAAHSGHYCAQHGLMLEDGACSVCVLEQARLPARSERPTARPPAGMHESERQSMLNQAAELERQAEHMLADAKALRIAAIRALGKRHGIGN